MTALATATAWRWPPDRVATGWRIDRTVVTWRLGQGLGRGALHAVLVEEGRGSGARGRGTCSGRCRGCRRGRGPGRRSRSRAPTRRSGCGCGPAGPPRRSRPRRAGGCRRCTWSAPTCRRRCRRTGRSPWPGRQVEVDPVEGLDRAEVLADAPQPEQRLRRRRARPRCLPPECRPVDRSALPSRPSRRPSRLDRHALPRRRHRGTRARHTDDRVAPARCGCDTVALRQRRHLRAERCRRRRWCYWIPAAVQTSRRQRRRGPSPRRTCP